MFKRLNRQQIFRDILIGTLIYSVVIGFYNDYTNILDTRSYSITFALAFVLQVLTIATIMVKNKVISTSKKLSGKKQKIILVFGVWAVMFFSKFVFLWVIGLIFNDTVKIDGFVNIMLVVLTMVIIQKVIEIIDKKLAD
jgi:hypothetical protein